MGAAALVRPAVRHERQVSQERVATQLTPKLRIVEQPEPMPVHVATQSIRRSRYPRRQCRVLLRHR